MFSLFYNYSLISRKYSSSANIFFSLSFSYIYFFTFYFLEIISLIAFFEIKYIHLILMIWFLIHALNFNSRGWLVRIFLIAVLTKAWNFQLILPNSKAFKFRSLIAYIDSVTSPPLCFCNSNLNLNCHYLISAHLSFFTYHS